MNSSRRNAMYTTLTLILISLLLNINQIISLLGINSYDKNILKEWSLLSTTETNPLEYYIDITEKGFNGREKCNIISGNHKINSNEIEFNTILSTKVYCDVFPFVQSLQKTHNYTIELPSQPFESAKLILKSSTNELFFSEIIRGKIDRSELEGGYNYVQTSVYKLLPQFSISDDDIGKNIVMIGVKYLPDQVGFYSGYYVEVTSYEIFS